MSLLSVLRNGDHRFLPLLLSKVHDVLPRLVNPMLQTVPDPPASSNTMCADVDIFDGFGSSGMGVPAAFPGYNGDGTSGSGHFKVEPDTDFNRPAPMSFDKLSSPVTGPSNDNTPFASPAIIQSPMEYPSIGEYNSFPDLNAHHMGNNHLGNFGEGVGGGGRAVEFKQEYGLHRSGSIGMPGPRRPPLRQGSSSSFGMQIPRSVPGPEQFGHLHNSAESGMGGPGDLPFR